MKTRLLKKVRKEFSITRYDSIATNASYEEKCLGKDWEFPFFKVTQGENGSVLDYNSNFFQTYDEAYATVVKWIRKKYFEKFKHKDADTTKVWWKK